MLTEPKGDRESGAPAQRRVGEIAIRIHPLRAVEQIESVGPESVSPVRALRLTLVDWSMSVTVIPATPAPAASVARPVILRRCFARMPERGSSQKQQPWLERVNRNPETRWKTLRAPPSTAKEDFYGYGQKQPWYNSATLVARRESCQAKNSTPGACKAPGKRRSTGP